MPRPVDYALIIAIVTNSFLQEALLVRGDAPVLRILKTLPIYYRTKNYKHCTRTLFWLGESSSGTNKFYLVNIVS